MNQAIFFNCPNCQAELKLTPDVASPGDFIDCPSCNESIEVTLPNQPRKQIIARRKQYTQPEAKSLKAKSIPLAIGLNILLPGIGYMYMGRVLLGFCVLILIGMILAAMSVFAFFSVWLGINLIMVIDMLILGNKREKEFTAASTKICPKCAETIKKNAIVCRFCEADVSRVF